MKCLRCGHIGDDQDFISDYIFDEEEDDEIPIYICPKCENSDDERFVDD